MEMFETIMTTFAVVAGAGAWFYMKRKQGAGLLDAAKSTSHAVEGEGKKPTDV